MHQSLSPMERSNPRKKKEWESQKVSKKKGKKDYTEERQRKRGY